MNMLNLLNKYTPALESVTKLLFFHWHKLCRLTWIKQTVVFQMKQIAAFRLLRKMVFSIVPYCNTGICHPGLKGQDSCGSICTLTVSSQHNTCKPLTWDLISWTIKSLVVFIWNPPFCLLRPVFLFEHRFSFHSCSTPSTETHCLTNALKDDIFIADWSAPE